MYNHVLALQFHPESVATGHGRQIFKNFADITKDYWFRFRSSSSPEGQVYAGKVPPKVE